MMIPIYTDDTTFLAITEEELIELLKRVEKISSEVGLQINKNKTKIMIIDRLNSNQKEITQISNIQVMERVIYLETLLTNKDENTKEIKK